MKDFFGFVGFILTIILILTLSMIASNQRPVRDIKTNRVFDHNIHPEQKVGDTIEISRDGKIKTVVVVK